MATFEKGHKKKGGRKKGSLNKTTALLKDAILQAAVEAGNDLSGTDGGLTEYLKVQAVKNPAPFMSLLGKVLPMQVNAEIKSDNTHEVVLRVLGPDDSG